MLPVYAIAFLTGAAALQLWPELPGAVVTALALGVSVIGLWWRPLRIVSFLILGGVLAIATAHARLADPLPPALINTDLQVRGTVVGLPAEGEGHVRFRLRVDTATLDDRRVEVPRLLRLSWYGPDAQAVVPGTRREFTVRLRNPRGFANPGGFDYPRWLFQEGIGATGHVRASAEPEYPARTAPDIHAVRALLRDGMPAADLAHAGTLTALAIGDRGRIDDSAWDVLLATGTNHLVAISGLHVGLAALAGFGLGRVGWHLLPGTWQVRLARPVVAALVGLAVAGVYAALAGFAIPTQRALIMLAAGLGTTIFRRRATPSEVIAVALFGVIAVDPLAPMASGFWLSFAAVAAILWVVCGRVGGRRGPLNLAYLQVAIAIALTPLLLLLFARTSIVGPLANLVAVPWVSFLVVPPTLVGTMLAPWMPTVGGALLQLADTAFTPLWWLLQRLAELPWSELHQSAPGPVALALAGIGTTILLAPRGIPGKPAAVVCLLPLVLAAPAKPESEALWLDVLDAGDGVASVIRTATRTHVLDSGPALSPSLDGGSAVVIPFLRAAGTGLPDTLVVTRDHARHDGGRHSLASTMPPTRSVGPPAMEPPMEETCRAGQSWSQDGVRFEVLHPRRGDGARLADADLACVLRIEAAGGSILYAPGLGHRAQWFLLTRDVELAADVFVAGQQAPWVDEFLAAVDPDWVIHTGSAPAADAGWPPRGTPLAAAGHARTDCGGAIRIEIDAHSGVAPPAAWREQRPRFWQGRCVEGAKSGTMRAVVGPGAR